MKKVFMLLLMICIFISAKIINAQQITGSPAEKKMSAMLLSKIKQFEKDSTIINIVNYKNKYGSKFIPVDGNGRMFLSITSIRNIDVVANRITSWGGIIHNKGTNILYAWVPMDKLLVLARMDGITTIDGPGYSYARTGSVTTAGDNQLLADSARTMFYTNGEDINSVAINVGVISNGMQHYTNSQQSGDLPTTNFGWVNNATSFIGDEGTAMMEIVHDLAPGAGLYFGGVGRYIDSNNDTISTTPLDMANVINALSSNCKVIVDDIGWIYGTPWFEDWDISQSIYNFQSNGGTYVSAAGNDAKNMYSGKPDIKTGGKKNWAKFNGSDTTLTFTPVLCTKNEGKN